MSAEQPTMNSEIKREQIRKDTTEAIRVLQRLLNHIKDENNFQLFLDTHSLSLIRTGLEKTLRDLVDKYLRMFETNLLPPENINSQ